MNSTDVDYSFLLTALYHWESKYPTFTKEYSTDPNSIVVKEEAKKEEAKKEDAKKEDAKKEDAIAQQQQLIQREEGIDFNDLLALSQKQALEKQESIYRKQY